MKRSTLVLRLSILVSLLAVCGLVAAGPASAAPQTAARSVTTTAHHTGGTSKGYTSVVVAPAVYQLVVGAGITPAPIGGAKAAPFKETLQAKFPITGFSLPNLRITHSGGISLTSGTATISLTSFNIDLGRSRVSGVVNGSIGNVGRVDLFEIARSDRLDLGLVRLTLTDTAAGALNQTFGVQAFSGGATFGYATPRPFARF